MIKFFRKIRMRLLSENKFSKYLLYAIGEIVLVVIGILIALSINNWNHKLLDSQKEKTYLDNLEIDLQNQLRSIDIQLTYENKYVNLAMPLLANFHENSLLTIDSVTAENLSILCERKTFIKTDPTYKDLISTGNIGLIKDQKLRKSLLEYYLELERYEKIIQNNNNLHVDEMFVQNIISSVYIGDPSNKLHAVSNSLLKDPAHEMVVINNLDFRKSIAQNHIRFMGELKQKTIKMLSDFKDAREG